MARAEELEQFRARLRLQLRHRVLEPLVRLELRRYRCLRHAARARARAAAERVGLPLRRQHRRRR
eukprot:scaffold70554_cov27-Phaeocystis_antarctica.AAC.1